MNNCPLCGRQKPRKAAEKWFCSCRWAKGKRTATPAAKPSVAITQQAPQQNHWIPLHKYGPENYSTWNQQEAIKWFTEWQSKIPSFGCNCQSHFSDMIRLLPPVMTSAEAFAKRAWDWHDAVSARIGKPRITWEECQGLYRHPWVQPKSRAIVTCAFGEHLEVLEHTRPLMQDYAKRCNADYIEITNDMHQDWPMANKWRASSYAWLYDQILYVDSDVIIKPNAPDIFEAGSPETFSVRNEIHDYEGREGWYIPQVDEYFHSQGVSHNLSNMANGGVMLYGRKTLDLYQPPEKPYSKFWCVDQFELTRKLELEPDRAQWLEDRWNWSFILSSFWEGINQAWFIHVNGSRPTSYRVDLIKRLIAGDYSRYEPPSGEWLPPWKEWIPYKKLSAPEYKPTPMASRKSNAIVVVAPNKKPQAEFEITGDLIRRYAARCSADFILIDKLPKLDNPIGYKYAAREVAQEYSKTLLLDADVIVRPGAPNIFEQTPGDRFALHDDLPDLKEVGASYMVQEWADMLRSMGRLPIPPMDHAWNSGVVMLPPWARNTYGPPTEYVPDTAMVEQHHLTYRLIGEDVFTLGWEWNCGWPWMKFPERLSKAFFLHANGSKENRLAILKELARQTPRIEALTRLAKADGWVPYWAR